MKANIIEANLKLVHGVLRRMYIFPHHSLYEDLVSAGKVGLVKAACTYKKKLGSFSNHAFYYIRKEIQVCMAESSDPAISYRVGSSYEKQKEKRTVHLNEVINYEKLTHIFDYHLDPVENLKQNERQFLCKMFMSELGDVELLRFVYTKFITKEETRRFKELVKTYYPEIESELPIVKNYLMGRYRRRAKQLIKRCPEYMEIFRR
jgi:hypothetical protein